MAFLYSGMMVRQLLSFHLQLTSILAYSMVSVLGVTVGVGVVEAVIVGVADDGGVDVRVTVGVTDAVTVCPGVRVGSRSI